MNKKDTAHALLTQLEQALEASKEWAHGTECTQINASGQTRYFNLLEFATVLNEISGAVQGQPLTQKIIKHAQRVISLSYWH